MEVVELLLEALARQLQVLLFSNGVDKQFVHQDRACPILLASLWRSDPDDKGLDMLRT